jgi:SAM-dependent methyltransferase
VTHHANDEQTALWNGPAGQAWVEAQVLLDQVLKPFENLLVRTLTAEPASSVLDVGCGTGTTTLAIARQGGATRRCTGVDISEPMITTAQARAEREGSSARFIRADAQVHPFNHAAFDTIVSRFGVMFFDDPVRAFTNLRRAATADARLCIVAWRSAAENPFMTTAERAAGPLLPDLPPRKPNGPGQFAFANGEYVHSILDGSGWTGVDVQPLDVTCTLPESELLRYVTRLGPVGMALQTADDETRARVGDALRAAFNPYVHGAEVRFAAACWWVSAHGGAR